MKSLASQFTVLQIFRERELHTKFGITNLSLEHPANARNGKIFGGVAMLTRGSEIGKSNEGVRLVCKTGAKLHGVLNETSLSCLCKKEVSLFKRMSHIYDLKNSR